MRAGAVIRSNTVFIIFLPFSAVDKAPAYVYVPDHLIFPKNPVKEFQVNL